MPKLDETENEFRYRIREPSAFLEDSFRRKNLDKPGLSLIVGKLRDQDSDSMVAQSIRFDKKNWDRSKSIAWIDGNKDEFSVKSDSLFSVKDVEIFSVGTWNGKEITEQDLDNMVDAFAKTKNIVRPFLKLGHNEDQKILHADGLPAAGWVENVKKNGSKLVADFVDIPKKIFQLITNKAYRNVSCEIYSNIKLQDNIYPKMLGAVSLLGSDMPAVMNLNDILSLYGLNGNFSTVEKFTTPKNIDTIVVEENRDENKKKDLEMTEKLKFQLEESQTKATSLESVVDSQNKEIEQYKLAAKKATDEKAASDKLILESAQREKTIAIDKFVGELVSDKICSKAMLPLVTELVGNEKAMYSLGDKEVSKLDLVREILKFAKEASKVNFSEKTSNSDKSTNDISVEVEKFAKDNDVSYSDAYRAVTRKN